jgi:hypothetical protein
VSQYWLWVTQQPSKAKSVFYTAPDAEEEAYFDSDHNLRPLARQLGWKLLGYHSPEEVLAMEDQARMNHPVIADRPRVNGLLKAMVRHAQLGHYLMFSP